MTERYFKSGDDSSDNESPMEEEASPKNDPSIESKRISEYLAETMFNRFAKP
jgi:hypothetical protein